MRTIDPLRPRCGHWSLKTLTRIVLSTPRVSPSVCCKARFTGNKGALSKKRSTAVPTQGQPNVKAIAGRVLFAALAMMLYGQAPAATFLSDGSDGAWHGGGTLALDTDGVFHFTTITVPLGATLGFTKNAANTPVVLAAIGNVVIDGTITVSAGHFNRSAAGPGGGAGGVKGAGLQAGTDGGGLAPGGGGPIPASPNPGNAGGGGGMATAGATASRYSNSQPGAGGTALGFAGPAGGSGGGGGSGWTLFGVELSGGDGGAAGGGLLITTPGDIIINGAILANGGHGAWAFANAFGHGGPGGGGSGGNVALVAGSINLSETAIISAIGGAGGGLSTQPVPNDPFNFSSLAHGGQGYVMFDADALAISPGAAIAATVVPLPPALLMLAAGIIGVLGSARRVRVNA